MKKRLTILLAILLLTGCTSAVNETDKTSEEPVAEETILQSAELLPEIPETTVAPPQTDASEPIPDEDTIYSDFDEILYEDESYRLAVHDGMIGIFTADGHLYAWLYGVDEAVFYPDETVLCRKNSAVKTNISRQVFDSSSVWKRLPALL